MNKPKPIKALLCYLAIVAFGIVWWNHTPEPNDGVVRAEFITMMIISLLVSAATVVLSELLRPKQEIEDAKPAGKGDFNFPTAVENRGKTIIFGKVKVAGPNVTWWGDFRQVPVKEKIKTGMWSSQRVITGYNYYVGIDMFVCRGGDTEVTLEKVFIGDRELPGGTSTSINQPAFFGGDEFGNGGLIGTSEFFGGSNTQVASTYLAQFQNPISGQQGDAHYIYTGYIGNSTRIEPWGFEVMRLGDSLFVAADAAGQAGDYVAGDAIVNTFDMNPMEVLYEAIANNDWGMGKPLKVNLANFAEQANTLKSEGNGFAMQVERNIKISELTKLVQQQIDGVLYIDKRTGLFNVRLGRLDYVLSKPVTSVTGTDTYNVASGGTDFSIGQTIFVQGFDNAANNGRKTVSSVAATTVVVSETLVNETPSGLVYGGPRLSSINGIDSTLKNKVEVKSFSRQTWSGTSNQVRIQFSDRSRDYFETFARRDNLANQRAQNNEIVIANATYPGVKNGTLATEIAAREVRLLSYPLVQASIVTNRDLWDVNPGQVIRLTLEQIETIDLAMLVTRVRRGDLGGELELDLVQDIFSLQTGFFGTPPASKWVYPEQGAAPIPVAESYVTQAPKAIVDRDPVDPTLRNRIWVGGRRQSAEITIPIYQRNHPTAPVGDFAQDGEVYGLFVMGRLDTVLSISDAQPTVTIQVEANPDSISEIEALFNDGAASAEQLGQELKYLIRIGDEFMLVSSVANVTSTTLELKNVYRGVMDSVPGDHAVDDSVFFLFASMGLSVSDLPPTQFVDVELLARSRDDQVTLAEADTISIEFNDRTRLPYPPVEMVVNATRFASSTDIDTQRPATSGLDNRGIDIFFDRRDYRTANEIESVLDDAESIDNTFPAANTTLHQLIVTNDPSGTADVVHTGTFTGSTRNLFVSRTEILANMPTPGAVPTTLLVEINSRHTVDGDVLDSRVPLAWTFTIDASDLDNDTNFGNLSDGVASANYTAPDTATYTVNLGAALGGNLEVNINGAGFVNLITAGGTSGTTASVPSGQTIAVRHQDAGTPETFLELVSNGASTVGAYAILVD